MTLKRIPKSLFSAALLRRYVLLLGSYNVIALDTARLGPRVVAAAISSWSTGPSSPPIRSYSSSISFFKRPAPCSPRYPWLKALWTPKTACPSTPFRTHCTEVIEELHWTEIDTEEFVNLIKRGGLQLFDVREPEELEETGRIPGAVNLPLGELEDALDMTTEEFEDKYGTPKPAKEDANIVFHCRAGIRSHTAIEIAHLLGYSKARHYTGGWLGWEEYLETQSHIQ